MKYFFVQSAVLLGIEAVPVRIECVQSRRLPFLQVLGGSPAQSAELRERVIAALESAQFRIPSRRITVQIQPNVASFPLRSLDLAVALAILGSGGQIPPDSLQDLLVLGELGLDGSLRGCGSLHFARRLLEKSAFRGIISPAADSYLEESSEELAGGVFANLGEVVRFLRAPDAPRNRVSPTPARMYAEESMAPPPDLIWSRLGGDEKAERLLEIAAAGGHHLLLRKSGALRTELLAHALSSLLPLLLQPEADEVRAIYAQAGLPFLNPSRPIHFFGTCSGLSPLLSDRSYAKVEEALFAHRGVLHLDQACEREEVVLSRLASSMREGKWPMRVGGIRQEVAVSPLILASAPSCACEADGLAGCFCRATEAKRYRERWRRLMRYPFDLALPLSLNAEGAATSSYAARAGRVADARGRMLVRQGKWNSRLSEAELLEGKRWNAQAAGLWRHFALQERKNPNRGLSLARVALTISDLRGGEEISGADLLEARHYFPEDFSVAASSEARGSLPEVNSSAMPKVRSPKPVSISSTRTTLP